MGGAERNARKRKQQRAAVGRAAAASSGTSRVTIVAVASVVILAVVVIGGILWMNAGKTDTQGKAIPVASGEQAEKYPGKRDGAVVVRGSADAKATIDIYEDFLCPYCGQLEGQYGEQIGKRIKAGDLRVRYHPVPLLNEKSDPPGYSLDAANATLCAADAGKFVRFHDSLFTAQPQEGGRGYSNGQLIELGNKLGAGEQFAGCVRNDTYDKQLKTALDKASNNPELKRTQNGRSYFATPTVVANGKLLQPFNNPNWLSDLLDKRAQ